MYTIAEIKRKIEPIARKYQIQEVYLFGSYARGDQKEYSDIDILVNEKGSLAETWEGDIKLFNDIERIFGKGNFDLVNFDTLETDKNFYKERAFFSKAVMDERVLIYENERSADN